jgi:hypothetical protein
MLELKDLKNAHPGMDAAEVDEGVHTHTLMTGGKFLFNSEPIPEHIEFPKMFWDLHRSVRAALPGLLGRRETYEDMLWLTLKHTILHRKSWEQDACLTEAISRPYHRFFIDLDLLFAREHESVNAWNIFVRKVCLGIGKAVLSCFPEIKETRDPHGQFEFSVLCTKGYRAKQLSETTTLYKRGLHLVWPNVIVDRTRSETLARAVDEYLTQDVPRDLKAGENAWKDAIDLSVYRSGLRPAGCAKITPCSKCRPLVNKKVSPGTSYDYRRRYLDFTVCHPPQGFVSHGEESVYNLDFLCRADGAVFTRQNFKVRLDAHTYKCESTGREFDFSLRHWTSIRTTTMEMTPGFAPPSHLRAPIQIGWTDYRLDAKQDPETGDFLPLTKRKRTTPRNSFAMTLGMMELKNLTRIIRGFHHHRYKNIIIDRVWAFPTEDARKVLPARDGEAPKRSLYNNIWVLVKGDGSNWCHNKPGLHGSSTIKFIIDHEGNIYQSCWCAKVYNGKQCCKQSTKGKDGFIDRVIPADYGTLVDVFTSCNT